MKLSAVAVAVIALAVAPAAPAQSATTTTLPNSAGLVYVAMGDSYSSGVGNTPYSDTMSTFVAGGATDSGVLVASPGNSLADGCDRSTLAQGSYATSVALALGMTSFIDVACSGATSSGMLHAYRSEPAQIQAVGPSVSLVTVTAGGNDAPSWVSVVEQCVSVLITTSRDSSTPYFETDRFIPGGLCAAAVAAKEAALSTSGTADLEALYRQILARMAPTGRLIVVPYPELAPLAKGQACLLAPTFPVAHKPWGETVGVSNANYGRLASMVQAMDAVIASAASAAGGTEPSRIVVAPAATISNWLNCQPWTERVHPAGLRGIQLLAGGVPPSTSSASMRPCILLDRLPRLAHQYAACVTAAWIARVASSLRSHTPIIGGGSMHPTLAGQSNLGGAVLSAVVGVG